eukprot:1990364-Pyramimonas_sp.AAC.1
MYAPSGGGTSGRRPELPGELTWRWSNWTRAAGRGRHEQLAGAAGSVNRERRRTGRSPHDGQREPEGNPKTGTRLLKDVVEPLGLSGSMSSSSFAVRRPSASCPSSFIVRRLRRPSSVVVVV